MWAQKGDIYHTCPFLAPAHNQLGVLNIKSLVSHKLRHWQNFIPLFFLSFFFSKFHTWHGFKCLSEFPKINFLPNCTAALRWLVFCKIETTYMLISLANCKITKWYVLIQLHSYEGKIYFAIFMHKAGALVSGMTFLLKAGQCFELSSHPSGHFWGLKESNKSKSGGVNIPSNDINSNTKVYFPKLFPSS